MAQLLLSYAGFNPGGIDGVIGKLTRAAAQGFREAQGMATSDEIDDQLIDALRTAGSLTLTVTCLFGRELRDTGSNPRNDADPVFRRALRYKSRRVQYHCHRLIRRHIGEGRIKGDRNGSDDYLPSA
jgi:peptidoglycan hydrolase-like protein with peptidoglycan-binding domain